MFNTKPFTQRFDRLQQRYKPLAFGFAVIKKYGEDGAGRDAALLTYYAFLALFPLLLIAITLTSLLIGNNPDLEASVINGITGYFPLLGEQLTSHIHTLHNRGLPLVFGVLFAFYGTRGVADAFQHGIQRIWRVPKRNRPGFPGSWLKSFGIVVIGGLGFILASVSAGLATAAGRGWQFQLLSIALNIVIIYGVFNLLLNFCLPSHVGLKDTRLGGIVAAIGLVVLQALGGYVLARELKSLDALYSYFAIALGLIFWIYLQAQMVYYAAEITIVSSQKLWPRSLDTDTLTPADKRLAPTKNEF